MEITPSPFAQMMGGEQAAPDAAPPAEGFSEVLAGAGDAAAPPGTASPPGATTPGEGVENLEPNAPSQRPDFLPETNAEESAVSLFMSQDDADASGPATEDQTDINAIAAAVAGALAMQLLPESANPAFSLKVVEGGAQEAVQAVDGVESVESAQSVPTHPVIPRISLPDTDGQPASSQPQPALRPEVEAQAVPTAQVAPVAQAVQAAQTVPTPAAQVAVPQPVVNAAPAVTEVETSIETPAAPPIRPVAKTPASAPSGQIEAPQSWQTTSRRALDDLALLTRNQDVIDRLVTDTGVAPKPAVQKTTAHGDFFAAQDFAPPAPVEVETPAPVTAQPAAQVAVATPTEKPVEASAVQASAPAVVPAPKTDGKPSTDRTETAQPVDEPADKPAVTLDAPQKGQSNPDMRQDRNPRAAQVHEGEKPATIEHESNGVAKGEFFKAATADGTPVSTVAVQTAGSPKSSTVAATPESQRATPLSRVETNGVIRQVVDRAEALAAARPRDGVVVHLEPKDLGSLTITVKAVGNHVDAQIAASNEHVRTALEQNSAQLGHAMEVRGLNLNTVTFDNQTTGSSYAQTQQQTTPQHDDRGQRQNPASTSRYDDRSTTAPSLETIRKSVRKADGVDLWT